MDLATGEFRKENLLSSPSICFFPLFDRFTVENVTEADLPHMSIEFAVWDHNTITRHRPLGQVKVGPNTAQDNYHWEEMIKNDGNLIKMLHPLREN